MKLGDKNCYPQPKGAWAKGVDNSGLTFRERLIVALASNGMVIENLDGFSDKLRTNYDGNARVIIAQADAIIKQLESEVK